MTDSDRYHCPACQAAAENGPQLDGAPHVQGVPPPEQMSRREYLARLAELDAKVDDLGSIATPEWQEAWHDRMGFAANWGGALANERFHGLRERARELGRRLRGTEADTEAEAG